jgi:hypothetical protein
MPSKMVDVIDRFTDPGILTLYIPVISQTIVISQMGFYSFCGTRPRSEGKRDETVSTTPRRNARLRDKG